MPAQVEGPNTNLKGPHLWEIRAVRDLFVIAIAFAALWLVRTVWDVLLPFMLALLFAFLCDPVIGYLERRLKMSRRLSTAFILLLIIALIAAIGFWLIPLLVSQFSALVQNIPRYLDIITQRATRGSDTLEARFQDLLQEANLAELIGAFFKRTSQALSIATRVLGATTFLLFNAVLIPFYFYFLAVSFPKIVKTTASLVPKSYRKQLYPVAEEMNITLGKFFRVRFLISVIMGVLFALGWWLVDVPYWFLLGMATGLLAIAPYASVIGWPAAVGLKYLDTLTGGGDADFWAVVVWPSAVYGIVQFLEGWIITPWLQSAKLDMNIVTVMLVVFVGGSLGGFLGIVFAIPLMACVKILYQNYWSRDINRWVATH